MGAVRLADADITTESSAFEALFKYAVPMTPQLAAGLRGLGYDPDRPAPRYPSTVWYACMDVARQRQYGNLPPEQGLRELGRRSVEGFFETLVGKVIAVGLPMLGTEGALKRLGRYLSSTSNQVTATAF